MRGGCQPNRSLYEIAVEHDLSQGLRLFDTHVDRCEHSFYRVRRIYYPKKGDVTKKGTTLLFDAQTIGRVSLSGAETSLQDCAAKASPRGRQLALPLTDDAKGRLSIGEVSLLFQFVDAPKAPVAAELPRVARGLLAQVDRSFLAILGISHG